MTLLVCAVVAHCAPIASLSSFAGVFQEREALTVTGEWTMGRESALSVSGRAVSSAGFDDSKWLPAKVPGTVLDNMVRNGLLPDPYYGINNRRKLKTIPDLNDVDPEYYTAWFRTTFDVPADYKGKNVWLAPEGINYRGEIWINGQAVGKTAGMFKIGRASCRERVCSWV